MPKNKKRSSNRNHRDSFVDIDRAELINENFSLRDSIYPIFKPPKNTKKRTNHFHPCINHKSIISEDTARIRKKFDRNK